MVPRPNFEPLPGDVVVLVSAEDGQTLLKRVVAGPGDLVTVSDGHVSINDREMSVHGLSGLTTEVLNGREHALNLENGGGTALRARSACPTATTSARRQPR